MAGIISGFLKGGFNATAEIGKMELANQIAKEREEANYLRDKELTRNKQDFQSKENQLDREAAMARNKVSASSKTTTKKDTRTSQQKNVEFLMSDKGGKKPLSEAITLSFPGSKIKHTDDEGNQIVVVPDGKGSFKEVGRIVKDENGTQQWLGAGKELPNAKITRQHREKAKAVASEKAGYLSSDKTDFPSTGGDRKEFIKQEAQRIANEERAAKKGGIVDSAMKREPVTKSEKMVGKRKVTKQEFMRRMIKKYGEDKKTEIERAWNSIK